MQRDRPDASDLMPLIYDELRALAAARLRDERRGHTLQPTALVHEVYLRLAAQDRAELRGREHFFALAASVLRRVLVDHARARHAEKRVGAAQRLSLSAVLDTPEEQSFDLIAMDDALLRLAELSERQARIVELRFFGGLSIAETAAGLGISEGTVKADWRMARAWLERELDAAGAP